MRRGRLQVFAPGHWNSESWLPREWTPGQWGLRAVVLVAVLVALLALGQPGHGLGPGRIAVGALLGVGFALRPDSSLGVVALGYVLVLAAAVDHHHLQASAIGVAVALLVAHVAATLAAYTPVWATPDRALARRWLERGALVLVPLVPVCVAAALIGSTDTVVWGLGAALVLALAVAVTALTPRRRR
jgi:hypothetical protein